MPVAISRDDQETTRHWCVRVWPRRSADDGHGRAMLGDIRRIGLGHVQEVRSNRLYLFAGQMSESEARRLAEELLTNPVSEQFSVSEGFSSRDDRGAAIEVHPLPGVMDPAALSTLDAARRMLSRQGSARASINEARTARRYEIVGACDAAELDRIASKVLANDCVEKWYIQGFDRHDEISDGFPLPPNKPFSIRRVQLTGLSDEALTRLSRDGHLFLSLDEMRAVRDHFASLKRDPTDLELETLAQTWSEHCVHKTLKSAVEYHGDDFGRPGEVTVRFDNLLKETIAAATHKLNRDWCLSVFVDNAGVIAFDDAHGVAFKVETHNHPSAIEPYGGAATGVGGCIRDIMGCGLGAKPIASTDVFCLAPPDFDAARVPTGVLHPRRVLKGVVSGVRDYGNRMGIPTVNGAIYFDDRYLANPLVFCGCVGLIPRDRIEKKANAGDLIVVAGGRTGRDGIHGATFSSAELTDSHADEFSHAVQIGNAIEEKKLLDAQLIARDHADACLYSAVTDCGAGGLSSAVGEMGADLGATVDLEKVPLKYAGLRYDEIWISEAQERMVFAVPPNRLERFLGVFAAEEVEATVIGRFGDDRALRVRYDGQLVGELDMHFLHEGLPKSRRTAVWRGANQTKLNARENTHINARPFDNRQSTMDKSSARLLATLGHLNVASKDWVIRQYDHEVQGRSVIKPLVGPAFGPSDAAVLRPVYTSRRGIALGCGLCPHWSDVDPYWMAVRAVDEALRNVVCVGADPMRTAILDNFCWPKADSEESLGALVRTCRGAHDAAIAYGLPFISGKDSLNNQFSMSAEEARRTGLPRQIAIPPTLLVSALGIVESVDGCVSMDWKMPGNVIVLASLPFQRNENNEVRSSKSEVKCTAGFELEAAAEIHQRVAALIRDRLVLSSHDVSDGGLAVALAEMCIASRMGAAVEFDATRFGFRLFDEPAACYVLEMTPEAATASGLPIIGEVSSDGRLRIIDAEGGAVELPVESLNEAWRSPLADGGGT